MKKTIVACVAVALVVGTTSATAASLITGKDIKNGTITGADLKRGSNNKSRLATGLREQLRAVGTQGAKAGAKGDKGDARAPGAKREKGDRGPAGPAGAMLYYEVNDGTNWALSNTPLARKNTENGYLDTGVVVDLGPASEFDGIHETGDGALAHAPELPPPSSSRFSQQHSQLRGAERERAAQRAALFMTLRDLEPRRGSNCARLEHSPEATG